MALLCYPLAMLTKRKKQNEMAKSRRHDTDTGSPEVQVTLLTRRIEELSAHLSKNNKDKHSRRGLLGLVADRRKHLKYLESTNKRAYGSLVKKLGLKK
jgi:small subunit ribosomal protein S15